MKNHYKCPDCGSPLPSDAPEELCPGCLLKDGLEFFQDITLTAGPVDYEDPHNIAEPGELLGEYRIERLLGCGAMGAVYEAEQLESGRRVALKVLSHKLNSSEARSRFLREGRLAASINHPNSVYVFGTGEIEDTPVIVMELVNGHTLQESVQQRGPMDISRAVDAIIDVISGLQAAEVTGILHRDVKPANCFEDTNGTVKVGDFGLSLSVEGHGDFEATQEGTFLGTPAFCSPEQLRGDELSARSDLYSVGVTFFYLLTARTPFQGKSTTQLFANVLEKSAPSPQEFRNEIPDALAQIVLRCLAKVPGDRFSDYESLLHALMPFASAAPTPAPIPTRILAGVIDVTILQTVASLSIFLCRPDLLNDNESTLQEISWVVLGQLLLVAYYAFSEGRFGASPGKYFCGLKLIDQDRTPPGYRKAALRAVIITALPFIPSAIAYLLIHQDHISDHGLWAILIGSISYLVFGLCFLTCRAKNGYAGVHDLASDTRVVRTPQRDARPTIASPDSEIETPLQNTPSKHLGSYEVFETISSTPDNQWHLGYDSRLLRKLWIRTVSPDTPEVPFKQRALGRMARLRWLAGRRSNEENWDAFEAPTGRPFLTLVDQPQPWESIRFWLHDLAEELERAEEDGSLPHRLSLDRVWITDSGHAKLLDFTAPGLEQCTTDTPSLPPNAFLHTVATAALHRSSKADEPVSIQPPPPLHARQFLSDIENETATERQSTRLKPLLQKTARVTHKRRLSLVGCCLIFPLSMALIFVMVSAAIKSMPIDETPVLDLSLLLMQRNLLAESDANSGRSAKPDDRHFAIYISHHYRTAVPFLDQPSPLNTRELITDECIIFSKQALLDYPDPTVEEIAEADAAMHPLQLPIDDRETFDDFQNWIPAITLASTLLFFVAIPAILAALLFKGGLVLLMCGVVVVKQDGRNASRLRVCCRSLLTWCPLFLPIPLASAFMASSTGLFGITILSALIAGSLTIWSICLPKRGLPDRLAGTTLVPR